MFEVPSGLKRRMDKTGRPRAGSAQTAARPRAGSASALGRAPNASSPSPAGGRARPHTGGRGAIYSAWPKERVPTNLGPKRVATKQHSARQAAQGTLPDAGSSFSTCVICFDSLTSGGENPPLPCTHTFHETCVGKDAGVKRKLKIPHVTQGVSGNPTRALGGFLDHDQEEEARRAEDPETGSARTVV